MDTIEAINTLANLKRYISGGGVVDRKASEAINMAIRALEVTADPDTVSRKQANDALEHDATVLGITPYDSGYTPFDAILTLHTLTSSPTPSRPTGYWMRMSDMNETEDDRYQCSYCGNIVHHRDKVSLYTYNSFCGACGANMNTKNYVAYIQGGAV